MTLDNKTCYHNNFFLALLFFYQSFKYLIKKSNINQYFPTLARLNNIPPSSPITIKKKEKKGKLYRIETE